MAATPSLISELPAIHNVSFEIEDATRRKSRSTTTNSAASDYSALSVTAPLFGAYSAWCGSLRRRMPLC
jgi:hypothetical protein